MIDGLLYWVCVLYV